MLKPLPGIHSRTLQTARLNTHVLQRGGDDGVPLLFIHGNFSSATYFEELMLALPSSYRCIAVDLRGYGCSEDLPIDATRGARDWADDLKAVFDTLGLAAAHIVGWSAGAAAIMQFMFDHADLVSSLTLIAPVSPYGFGGSKDLEGTPCFDDFAGSGGGLVAPEFVKRISEQDRSNASPLSPRSVIARTFASPAFHFSREEDFLTASLRQKVGNKRYPGDYVTSQHWPYTSPGEWGPINAISSKYLDLSGIVELAKKPPILWVRGDSDLIISDRSLSDPAVLGEMGLLPGWPGMVIYPTQPMVSQTRALLDRYRDHAGHYLEIVLQGVGHSPFLEKPEEFRRALIGFISDAGSSAGES